MRRAFTQLLPAIALVLGGTTVPHALSQQLPAEQPAAAIAGNAGAEHAFRAFLACDASFFSLLQRNPLALGANVLVAPRAYAAVPVVNDPLLPGNRSQLFPAPVNLGDLNLVGWHNEVSHRPGAGSTLFWGFTVAGSPAEVASAINSRLPDGQRLVHTGPLWARAEIRNASDPVGIWRTGGTLGVVTPAGTVERVLLVSASAAAPTYSTVQCTLQGSVTPAMLMRERPDLLDREYP